MAKSTKDSCLTLLGIIAGFGVYMGLQGILGPVFSGILAIITFIFVAFFDYILYYSKVRRERVASRNIICENCHQVVNETLLECPNCYKSL